ncbi:hypothetical protein BJX62DRAFT_213909 [Aspergillus germanicus]
MWFYSDEAERDALCWGRIRNLNYWHTKFLLLSSAAIFPPSPSPPPFAIALHSFQGTLFALFACFLVSRGRLLLRES